MKPLLSVFLTLVLFACTMSAQAPKRKYPIGGSYPNGNQLKVAPDIDARLAKLRRTPMPFNSEKLTVRERKLVDKLVLASRYLDYIYWRQTDPEGLTLYKQLEGSKSPRDEKLVRLLWANAGRFDLLEEGQPFVGTEPASPGRALYPAGLTREEIEQYVKDHPEKKNDIYSGYTIVRRQGKELEAIPYRVAFRTFLEPAANALRDAAALSADKAFAEFLRKRADALLTDDYYPSDLLWLDLKDPKFDVIFAPYETYVDGLLGVKTSYGAAVLIRNEAESKKLAIYQKYVPQIQDALPIPAEDRPSKQGHLTPMEVMDAPFRAGDLDHGYQAVADNLPNDPRIHAEKGTKKIFFKNFMDARVNYIILPVAQLLMEPDQARKASGGGYLSGTLMHEISHGLGPAFARINGKQVDIREAIGPMYSGLEEAKADVVGMFGLKWLIDQGYIPKETEEGYWCSYLAGMLRSVRFGTGEAHGRAEMMEFNYLVEQGAIRRGASGRYSVDFSKIPGAISALAKELLEQEATGDRQRTENWFQKYGAMPPELKTALESAKKVPVDIDPVFSFPRKVQ